MNNNVQLYVLSDIFFLPLCNVDKEKQQKAKVFASNVKKYRKEKKLSQVQVAELADTSTRQIQAIEYGDRVPNVILAYFVAKALEIPLDKLLEDT